MYSDDELPTWLHTLCCLILGLPFALPLLFYGGSALLTKKLEPLIGPDIGQYFFGGKPLVDAPALIAGVALLCYGAAFLFLSVSFTRYAEERVWLRRLPFLLLAMGVGTTFLVKH